MNHSMRDLRNGTEKISTIGDKKWSFDDFGFSKCLGVGQYGKVFLAKEKKTGSIVAIKVIWFENYIHNGIEGQIKNEIEIHAALIHNRITRVYGAFYDSIKVALVMEYAPLGTLFNMMCQDEFKEGFEPYLVQQIGVQIFSALLYCHARYIMHRDLKPENVLITAFKKDTTTGHISIEVKLSDFGWSIMNRGNTRKTICGTQTYMAPEILDISNGGYGYKAESFAFGMFLWEMVIGMNSANFINETTQCPETPHERFKRKATAETVKLYENLTHPVAIQRMELKSVVGHHFFVEKFKDSIVCYIKTGDHGVYLV